MDKASTSVVDRLIRRRVQITFLLGLFVAVQSTRIFVFEFVPGGLGVTLREGLSFGAWLNGLLVVAVYGLFVSGLWRGAAVRQRLNDEGTLANWRAALAFGFWAMMAGAAICLIASESMPLTARQAVQFTVSLGAGLALLCFSALERRALHA